MHDGFMEKSYFEQTQSSFFNFPIRFLQHFDDGDCTNFDRTKRVIAAHSAFVHYSISCVFFPCLDLRYNPQIHSCFPWIERLTNSSCSQPLDQNWEYFCSEHDHSYLHYSSLLKFVHIWLFNCALLPRFRDGFDQFNCY